MILFLKNFVYISYELKYFNKFLIRYLILIIASYYFTSISVNFNIEFLIIKSLKYQL